ncbi:MAG: serine/threonine-protein kinase [Bryobacteraceae bacterium]
MTAEHWKRLRDLFDQVVAAPEAERAGLLAGVPDESLRLQVASLIAADEGADGVLDRALRGVARKPVLVGDHLAQYEIVEPLGQGGMGEVFLARRRDDLQQKVAIKIAAATLTSEEASRRFLAERRILAGLNHPHIARFLDAGATEAGVPWVAMEFVDGKSITEYCQAAKLPLEARLLLFAKVCLAVQHAHNNLIVHRDIKPANILVDADGEPRLVDFGIAKLLAGEEEGLTRSQFRPMTPQYASPEQARGEVLTTATDVYSLSVVLQEVLTGCLPHALKGDLELIVRTGMHQDPLRRYASPAALAEDLNRFRNGFPIAARPDSWRYRAGKMIGRNRVASVLAALALVLVLSFGAVSVVQARRIAEERDAANQVSAFLVGIFEGADRGKTNGESVNARQLLDRGAARVERELRNQPKTQARLYAAIGRVYQNLGATEAAAQMFRKEVELRRDAGSEGDAALGDSMQRLVEVLRRQAKYNESIPMAREALELTRRSSPAESQPVADALNTLGLNLNASGKPRDAEAVLRESLAIKRKIHLLPGYETAVTLQNLADVHRAMSRHGEATPLLRESMEIRQRLYGANDARTARAAHALGMNLHALGESKESESLLRYAVDVHTRLYGEQHLDTASMVNSLASLLHDRKRHEEAEALYLRALSVQEALQGAHSPGVAITLNNLGTLRQDRGDLAGAEGLFRRSVAMREKLYGNGSPQTARAKHNLGVLLMARKQYGAAESLFREAVAGWEEATGTSGGNSNLAVSRFQLAMAIVRGKGRAAGAQMAEASMGEVRRLLPEASVTRKKAEAQYAQFVKEGRQ